MVELYYASAVETIWICAVLATLAVVCAILCISDDGDFDELWYDDRTEEEEK